ncbi:MAG: integrin [Gammaproteobacteria bacterium]
MFVAVLIAMTACSGGGGEDGATAVTHTVSTNAGANGSISPNDVTANDGATTSFTITPDDGYGLLNITGCNGSMDGNTYTTGPITGDCVVSAIFEVPGVPVLTPSSIKTFNFSWVDVSGATHYKLLENSDGSSGFTQVGQDIAQGARSVDHIIPLYARLNAQYILQTCDDTGCSDSEPVSVSGSLADSVGYFKASNTVGLSDYFGYAISLSADGSTLAVGAPNESSAASGINGNQEQHVGTIYNETGAVYVFTRDGEHWNQQAYIKASNPGTLDSFGASVSLSSDGNTLVVGAEKEASNATGVGGNQSDNNAPNAGAVYVFTRSGNTWSQQEYIKASNTDEGDLFGSAVSISADGNIIAVGAYRESSSAIGINGDQNSNAAYTSGAVYVFARNGNSWDQQAYIKASNTDGGDYFGYSLALDADGNTLVVGAYQEASNATGVNGDDTDDNAMSAGAVYVFAHIVTWSQQAYLKSSNSEAGDGFGVSVSLAADGSTLAVGATGEDSSAVGVGGVEDNNNMSYSGAVYIFARDFSDNWSQQTYIKASNTGELDGFGTEVSLAADGNTLAVGASGEASSAIGLNGTGNDDSADNAGAVYVFTQNGGSWSQQAYIKASNSDSDDGFGYAVAMAANGQTLAVGAVGEDSRAKGIGGDQNDNSSIKSAGAVYLY